MLLASAFMALCVAQSLACKLVPGEDAAPKLPGDNFYRLLISDDVERYAPSQRYVVTLVGSRTHDVVQQFTRFQLQLDSLDPTAARDPRRQGQFQLFADTLSRFDDECTNSVVEADTLPKTEVQVMWKAPQAGSGCVLIKAMVYENESRWFAEDGQLTKQLCENTSLSEPEFDCCACDDATYQIVFEGLWSAQTHHKDLPMRTLRQTHFSDLIGATHTKNFWKEGELTTDKFRLLSKSSDFGFKHLMESKLRAQAGSVRSVLRAPGLSYPRLDGNTSATATVDRHRNYLSVGSMFGPSPHVLLGVSNFNLCNRDCAWARERIVDIFPYEINDYENSYEGQNAEDPRAPFYGADGSPLSPLARLHVVRDTVIPRSCDNTRDSTEDIETTSTGNEVPGRRTVNGRDRGGSGL